jgi:uncharacterized protein YecA (UPF0149 family)
MFFAHADGEFKRLVAAWRHRTAAEEAKRERATAGGRTGRNAPCPCGSGLKFKRCCGR